MVLPEDGDNLLRYAARSNSRQKVDKSSKGGIMKANKTIGRSIGASAKNYPVILPDGNHAKFQEGSTITKIKVIAGSGTDVPIGDAIYFQERYKIPAQKRKNPCGKYRSSKRCATKSGNSLVRSRWRETRKKGWLDDDG